MSFDGNGTFNQATTPVVSGTVISSTNYNSQNTDFANGLSNVICKDGQTTIAANLPMAGYRHTGVGNAGARNDYAAAGQVQDGAFIWCGTAGGTADALTLTPSPAITAYATGQVFRFKAGSSANTGAATVAVSGLTAKDIQNAGSALTAGAVAAGKWYTILYDGTNFQLQSFAISSSVVTSGVTFTNTDRILGRDSSGGGAGEELTLSTVLDFIGSAAQGDILYRGASAWGRLGAGTSGQFLKTQGAGANPTWDSASAGWTVATPQATTSGTAIDFTGIPSTAKKIAVLFNGVSLSGSDEFLIQIGDSGGIEASGYVSGSGDLSATATSTTGFVVRSQNGGTSMYGEMTLSLYEASSFTWISAHAMGRSDGASPNGGGTKSLSAALDRVRITRTGSNTFDAGSVTVAYTN